jgi:hypothetical protein
MTPIDIFISYKREERALTEHVANALREEGYVSVTDLNIQKAESFSDAIDAMIQSARLVIVLWTKESAQSDWVRKEAEEAWRLKKYFGVMIEKLPLEDLPLAVRHSNYLDISGKHISKGSSDIVSEVNKTIDRPKSAPGNATKDSNLAEGDLEFFQVVEKINRIEGYRRYMEIYPNGTFADVAATRIRDLSRWYPRWAPLTVLTEIGALAAIVGDYYTANPHDLTTLKAEITGVPLTLKRDLVDNR